MFDVSRSRSLIAESQEMNSEPGPSSSNSSSRSSRISNNFELDDSDVGIGSLKLTLGGGSVIESPDRETESLVYSRQNSKFFVANIIMRLFLADGAKNA